MPRQLVLRVEWFDDRFAGVELLLADVGQALAQFGDQRIIIGQDALQAVGRVA